MRDFSRLVGSTGGLLASIVPMRLYGQPLGLLQLRGGSMLLPGLTFALVAILALVGLLLLRRRRKASSRRHGYPDPPLVFPISGDQPRAPAELPQPHGHPEAPEWEPRAAPPVEPERRAAEPVSQGEPIALREEARPPEDLAAALPANGAATPAPPHLAEPHEAGNGGEYVEGRTVRYYRPVESTVQFLPGRLEIVDGEDGGQDIRFIRTRGAVPEITFGRSSGPPHRHVQLRARTVSREHARLRYEESGWRIGNLSRTNPVVVNGEELHSVEETRALSDGDLIEMGEVVFRFRER